MKKIAIFTITLSKGGAERVISNLLLNFSSEKYEKYLILLDDNIVYPYDGKLILLKTFENKNIILKALNYIIALYKLIKLKKQYKFDICISFLDIPNFLNILSKQNEKVYVSVRTHITDSYKKIKKIIYGTIIKKFYNKSDLVIAVSNECEEDLINSFGIKKSKTLVIHNFYDLEKIEKLSNEALEDEYKVIFSKKVLINSGRMTEQKGQRYLLEMFRNLENKEEYNLVILGEGKLKRELIELSKQLGIEKNVHFLGFQINPFKFLKHSYLFLFPSFSEGFPNALAEAMACGLPVISNNCKSGPKELLKNGEYGVLIDDYLDKEKLASRYEREIKAFETLEYYNGFKNKSLNRIKEFDKFKIIKKWEEILK